MRQYPPNVVRLQVVQMRAAAVQLVRNVLQEVGTILVMRPDEQAAEIPEIIEVALASGQSLDWVERKSKIPTVVSKVYVVQMESVPTPAPSLPEEPALFIGQLENNAPQAARAVRQAVERPKSAREDRPAAATENVIRVDTDRVDVVLDLVG